MELTESLLSDMNTLAQLSQQDPLHQITDPDDSNQQPDKTVILLSHDSNVLTTNHSLMNSIMEKEPLISDSKLASTIGERPRVIPKQA